MIELHITKIVFILSKVKTYWMKYFKKFSVFVISNQISVISLRMQHIKYATNKSN